MRQKVKMKKIEDVTKCQVTFSKRRSSLMKKANEISVCCDAEVAFVAFSPSGRVSKYCNKRRIEDVIHRYVNLPPERRLNHVSNVQEKQEKLRQLDHIKGDTSKLHFLDKQIENLELQIKKNTLELQIMEADLRDYEPNPEQEPSLHQLSWCERNLKQSLQKVMSRKNVLFGRASSSSKQPGFQMDEMEMSKEGSMPVSYNLGDQKELDPCWISPYRDYEPSPEQEPSLHQLSWCERNLKQSLEKVVSSKMDEMELSKEGSMPVSYNLGDQKEVLSTSAQNPDPAGQLLMQLDPWLSPYSARVRESILRDLLDQEKRAPFTSQLAPTIHPSRIFSETLIPQLSSIANQSLPTFPNREQRIIGRSTVEINNRQNAPLGVQEGVISNQCLSGSQPRNPLRVPYLPVNAPFIATSTSTVTAATRAGNGLDVDEFESLQQQMIRSKTPPPKNNSNNDDSDNKNNDLLAVIEQPELSIQAREDSLFDILSINQDTLGDTTWTQGIQNCGLWEWEDLIFSNNI